MYSTNLNLKLKKNFNDLPVKKGAPEKIRRRLQMLKFMGVLKFFYLTPFFFQGIGTVKRAITKY